MESLEPLVKKPYINEQKTPYIVQCFLNADLRGSHDSLSRVAKKNGLDTRLLTNNQFVVFINRRRNMMKCFVAGNTISFTKRDRIDLAAISKLPQAFGSTGDLNYDHALELALEERLSRRK